ARTAHSCWHRQPPFRPDFRGFAARSAYLAPRRLSQGTGSQRPKQYLSALYTSSPVTLIPGGRGVNRARLFGGHRKAVLPVEIAHRGHDVARQRIIDAAIGMAGAHDGDFRVAQTG